METTGEKFNEQDEQLISMNIYLAAQGEPVKGAKGTEKDVEKKHIRKKKKKKKKVDESDGWWDMMNTYPAAKGKPLKYLEVRNHKQKNKNRNIREDPDSLRADNWVSKCTTAIRHLKRTTGIPR